MLEFLCQTLPPVWSLGELGQMEIFEKPGTVSGNLLGLSKPFWDFPPLYNFTCFLPIISLLRLHNESQVKSKQQRSLDVDI